MSLTALELWQARSKTMVHDSDTKEASSARAGFEDPSQAELLVGEQQYAGIGGMLLRTAPVREP
jgi:hypothetical protein